MMEPERIGEIIETHSFGFTGESFALNRPPALGSLVKVQSGEHMWTYGLVTYGETAAADAGRQPVRRSQPDAFDGDVYTRHPELELLLRTTFTAITVGHAEASGRLSQRLPAQPPPLHYSIYACDRGEVREFTDRLLYLRTVANAQMGAPGEHVLAANLRWAYEMRGSDRPWLDRAALEVATLLQQDVERLLAVLYSVDPEA